MKIALSRADFKDFKGLILTSKVVPSTSFASSTTYQERGEVETIGFKSADLNHQDPPAFFHGM